MNTLKIQALLAAGGYYSGKLDGKPGPLTTRAIDSILERNRIDTGRRWNTGRRAIAAAQLLLKASARYFGNIDGFNGHLTEDAFAKWEAYALTGKETVLPQTPIRDTSVKSPFPLQKDCPTFYGEAGSAALQAQLVYITPPYPMRLDYDLKTPAKSIRLHKKCAKSAEAALQEIVDEYGLARLQQLGLDRYAGAYANRPMRGGKAPSMHAYGAALDNFAAPNGLTTRCPEALFCGKDYTKYFDIWESHGWISLGREIGRDWMHVQAARLK